jgi:hypothetical protein
MTTSDKKPRRTTKGANSAKTAKSADTPGPLIHTKATPAGATDGEIAAGPAASLASAAAPAKSAGRARSPAGASKAGDNQRIKDVSVTVTSRHREDRHASIALAAYFRSESRGFAPGHEVEDWLAAEEEVDQRLLGEGRVS